MALADGRDCFLEWWPYSKDREMGLNHQLASLSCSLSEAFFLRRTLVLPSTLCLFGLHTERWPGTVAGARCIPIEEILDTGLLTRLVPIYLRANRTGWVKQHFPDPDTIAHVSSKSGWKSEKIRSTYPCGGPAKLVRRHVESFWFSQCTRRTVDTEELARAMNELIGAPPTAPKPMNIILRSGLFFSPQIKAAAAAIRARIAHNYASIHVRRSDKLTACDPQDCVNRDLWTRPDAIVRALRLWIPEQSHVYIGSTERPGYFAPLRKHFQLHFADDFPADILSACIAPMYRDDQHHQQLRVVETFNYQTAWFSDACFPAKASKSRLARNVSGISSSAVWLECRDNEAALVNESLMLGSGSGSFLGEVVDKQNSMLRNHGRKRNELQRACSAVQRPRFSPLPNLPQKASYFDRRSKGAGFKGTGGMGYGGTSGKGSKGAGGKGAGGKGAGGKGAGSKGAGSKGAGSKGTGNRAKKKVSMQSVLSKLQHAQEDHAHLNAQIEALDLQRQRVTKQESQLLSELQRLVKSTNLDELLSPST